MQFKQPQLQIARSYTLLPPVPGTEEDELHFLIRRERNGEVSGYLHRLPLDAEVDLRGLSAEYELPENVDRVVFLAGGTGIAPALQVASLLAGKADVHVLWASRRREDCVDGISDTKQPASWKSVFNGWWNTSASPASSNTTDHGKEGEEGVIVSQLETMKQRFGHEKGQRKLIVDYYVDEEGTFIDPKNVDQLLQSSSRNDKTKLLFVAGPDGFVNHWAGTKEWKDGQEIQGPLRGVLSSLDVRGWKVLKL